MVILLIEIIRPVLITSIIENENKGKSFLLTVSVEISALFCVSKHKQAQVLQKGNIFTELTKI